MANVELSLLLADLLGSSGAKRGEQLYRRLRSILAGDALAVGDRLPSGRSLAAELGLARGTVSTAIDRLVAEGLLEARPGSGTYVAARLPRGPALAGSATPFSPSINAVPIPIIDTELADDVLNLRPCRPAIDNFPLLAWRRALTAASLPTLSPDYPSTFGEMSLRREVASYLGRLRGLRADSDSVLICNGALHGLQLLASVLTDVGDSVAIERPGYPLARQALAQVGRQVVGVEVDRDGLVLEALDRLRPIPKLVVVTPAHQFPLGCALSLERRRDLLAWARRRDVVIAEDDYDGEFRYDVPPLPPLAALDPSRVAYLGTFSKALFPGLRLGFVAAHPELLTAMANTRGLFDYATPSLTQLALARFMQLGEFERHLHRMRRRYSQRRSELVEALASVGPGFEVMGLESGMHVTVGLPSGVCAAAVSAALAADGIAVPALDAYGFGQPTDEALVVGYAAAADGELTEAVHALCASVDRERKR